MIYLDEKETIISIEIGNDYTAYIIQGLCYYYNIDNECITDKCTRKHYIFD